MQTAWQNILDGRHSHVALTDERYAKLPTCIAACVPNADQLISEHLSKSDL